MRSACSRAAFNAEKGWSATAVHVSEKLTMLHKSAPTLEHNEDKANRFDRLLNSEKLRRIPDNLNRIPNLVIEGNAGSDNNKYPNNPAYSFGTPFLTKRV